MQKLEIPSQRNPDDTYLLRLRLVQTPWFGIYLHKINEDDGSRLLHDHPWPFISLLLRGSYEEIRDYSGRVHTVRRFNKKKTTDLHSIMSLSRCPVWTLMFVGRRQREWGFVAPDGTWTVWHESPAEEVYKQRAERKK